jgi:hypothetical protein
MPRAGSPYGPAHEKRRRALLGRGDVLCEHCQLRPATVADHQPPLLMHDHVEGSDCCGVVPSCAECSSVQGGLLAWVGKAKANVEVPDPDGLPPDDPCWDVPWLDELRDVPPEGTWPRLMSAPHPRAVGSYGVDAEAWILLELDVRLRWWQRLALTRFLEHDRAGQLVWLSALLSTSRQNGKSWLLRGAGAWRLHQADRFGEPQTIVHTGKDVAVCKEVITPVQLWAEDRGGYKMRHVNGQEEIKDLRSGSRWIVRARGAVYGYSASWAVVDEAWGVHPDVVDDGLEPTMIERRSPQLLLTSTAHRKASNLFAGRRAAALLELAAPSDVLLVEWSASRSARVDDRVAWRQASPYWSGGRERLLEARLARVEAGESLDPDETDATESFRAQFLNVWPALLVDAGPGEPIVSEHTWRSLEMLHPGGHGRMWVAVEDDFGRGAALAVVAPMSDGRWEVDGRLFATVDEAYAQAEQLAPFMLMVGASLGKRFPKADLAGAQETKHGLPLLRELAEQGRVLHDRTPDLDEQIFNVRVREGTSGLSLVPGKRSDLLRALCWALRAAVAPKPVPAIH